MCQVLCICVLCWRREAEATTVQTLHGSPVIIVAPSSVPAKKIPQELNQSLLKLEQRIENFEEAAIGPSTVPTVGVLADNSKKEDNGTIINTISSAQYIVHWPAAVAVQSTHQVWTNAVRPYSSIQLVTRSKPVYWITQNTKFTVPFFEINWPYFLSVHKRNFSKTQHYTQDK